MNLADWASCPSDWFAKALECGAAWDEGKREALADMDKAEEMKQQTKGKR